jgi:prepilin-type N-terminal cleavage/methylation domain-containing protein
MNHVARNTHPVRTSTGRRGGYTLAEMLTVFVIVGILANIAIPMYHRARLEADATRVIADFGAIRHAALHHISQAGSYPPSSGWRHVPPELVSVLPAGFAFSYQDVEYRWRRWSTGNGLPRRSHDPALVGIEIRSDNLELLADIRGRFGGIAFGMGNRVTLVIE